MEKSVQENLDIRMKTKKEVESELNKFMKNNEDTDDKEKLIIQDNLEKTLKTIDEEIKKLEEKNKDLVNSKKETLKEINENHVTEDDIKKTEAELESAKQQLNSLTENNV